MDLHHRQCFISGFTLWFIILFCFESVLLNLTFGATLNPVGNNSTLIQYILPTSDLYHNSTSNYNSAISLLTGTKLKIPHGTLLEMSFSDIDHIVTFSLNRSAIWTVSSFVRQSTRKNLEAVFPGNEFEWNILNITLGGKYQTEHNSFTSLSGNGMFSDIIINTDAPICLNLETGPPALSTFQNGHKWAYCTEIGFERVSIACNLPGRECLNRGECIPVRTEHDSSKNMSTICLCHAGYSGLRCETRLSGSECHNKNLCLNGGTCIVQDNQVQCLCLMGFHGEQCESVDSTNGHRQQGPCGTNGICPLDSQCVNGQCVCQEGYIGTPGVCHLLVSSNLTDPCDNTICQNGGKCYASSKNGILNRTYCICARGFTGQFCERRRVTRVADGCAHAVCGPGKRCIGGRSGAYKCIPLAPVLHNSPPLADDPRPILLPTAPPFPSSTGNNAIDTVCEEGTSGSPFSRRCLNNGRCLRSGRGGASCLCTVGWTGAFCETAVISCDSILCQNNGTCREDTFGRALCHCPVGFTGNLCDNIVGQCDGNQCLNGGTCIAASNGHTCQCAVGYTGERCEVPSLCDPSQCQNGGTCISNSTTCQCPIGFTGQFCETNIDDCASVQCPNGKICVDGVKSHQCPCPTGFFGANCQFQLASSDECRDCKNGATCLRQIGPNGNFTCVCRPGYTGPDCQLEMDECQIYGNPCQNGGTCLDSLVGYECRCPIGITGIRCDIGINNTNCDNRPCPIGTTCINSGNDPQGYTCLDQATASPCSENPCWNGAMCIDLPNSTNITNTGFTCVCLPGFTGVLCESSSLALDTDSTDPNLDIDPCSNSNRCQNGGSCRAIDGDVACLCPAGYTGVHCENDMDECQTDPCGDGHDGKWICVNTLGSYQCQCEQGWMGEKCNVQMTGCHSNPCQGHNQTCMAIFENGQHGHTCQCSPGFYGSNCTEESTLSFNGNSLIYHLNPTAGSSIGASSDQPSFYTIKFHFRTTLSNVIITEGVDITPTIIYTLSIQNGKIKFDWNPIKNDKRVHSVSSHRKMNNGEWYGVDLVQNGSEFRLNLLNNNDQINEIIDLSNHSQFGPISTFPIFTTKFGGLSTLSTGKWYFIGCMRDILINGERLMGINNALNIIKGCHRKPQCELNNSNIICGGSGRGRCLDEWDSYSCRCKRPYLPSNCSWELKEATFGYEGNVSYVRVNLDENEKKSVELEMDISMIIRTTGENGMLAYIGSNLNSIRTRNAYQTFITLEIAGGKLKSMVQLGPSQPVAFTEKHGGRRKNIGKTKADIDQGIGEIFDPDQISEDKINTTISNADPNSTSTRSKMKRGKLNDGHLHLVRLVRQENEIRGYVDGTLVFGGKLNSPFPYPLLIDNFYLGGMPSGGVANVIRQKRKPRRTALPIPPTIVQYSFKGTLQDVRVNGQVVPLLKKHSDILIDHAINVKRFGTPIPRNNVLEGTVPDDLCRINPCGNSGICKSTFNDYDCICTNGWWGKNCTLEDTCVQRQPCGEGARCYNLQKSAVENGYVCLEPVTLNETSSMVFYEKRRENESEDEDEMEEEIKLEIRTRSRSGVILAIFNDQKYSRVVEENGISKSINRFQKMNNDGKIGPNYFILELINGTLSLHYSIEKLSSQVGLKKGNKANNLALNHGQWHTIKIQFETEGLIVSVDGVSQRIEEAWEGYENGILGKMIDSSSAVYLGMVPNEWRDLVEGNGHSLKGCLRDVRIGKDGWLLFHSQSTAISEIVSASQTGRIFITNSTSSIDRGCHSDDVCHNGNEEVCLNGATCQDEWNQFKCHCPFGYQGSKCQENIDDCIGNQCSNGATCLDGIGNYTCFCPYGFTGSLCGMNIDDCASSPCQNNGTCVDSVGGFQCQCNANYAGNECEIWLLVDCTSNPCQHGASCVDIVLPPGHKSFNCTCPASYFGRMCEREVDFCQQRPCQNGANCTSRPDLADYQCSCLQGFMGRVCEENIDECLQYPCTNGRCIDGWGNFTCQCSEGWAGAQCDEDINECEMDPCTNTGHTRCLNNPGSYQCACPEHYFGENCEVEGECIERPCARGNCSQTAPDLPRHCQCPYGWNGTNCENEINFCESIPCQNGGTCYPFTGGFRCYCPLGFKGVRCEININECEWNLCANSGVCIDGIGQYTCNCSGTGFTGPNCRDDVDECQIQQMCLHAVSCKNSIGSYQCTCREGYLGQRCNVKNPCNENGTHSCQNGARCIKPRVSMENTINGPNEKMNYECSCPVGFHGQFCEISEKRNAVGLANRLEYILGPIVGALGLIFIIVGGVFLLMVRKKRANHGTYSPSRQEVTGARMQMGPMMKPPPEERLI